MVELRKGTSNCSLKFTPHKSLSLLGADFLDGALMDPMWNEYIRPFGQNYKLRNVESLSSHFVGPKPMCFQACFGL